MEVQDRNGVKVYGLSTGKPLPSWLGERARRNLSKRDETVRRRIDLIQDFQFTSSSSKLRQSANGQFLAATGSYPPSIKMYELSEMALKFERRLDAEAVDFRFLSDDYGKLVILEADRNVEFQAPYGKHYKVRIPTFGRSLVYEPSSCELYVTSCSGDVYKINLEEGRFEEPLNEKRNDVPGTTCCEISPTHRMLGVGGEDGVLRFYDTRTASTTSNSLTSAFSSLDIAAATSSYGFSDTAARDVTSLAFEDNGVMMAVGTSNGCVALYDIRSSKPLHVKEHNYGLPIHTCAFHHSTGSVLSADKKIIKGWKFKGSSTFGGGVFGSEFDDEEAVGDVQDSNKIGSAVCNIEAAGDFNHFIIGGDENFATQNPKHSFTSGLLLCAGEQTRCQAFYAPTLGPAPRWCSFLDNITEELEERNLSNEINSASNAESVYEDYKFLTRDEVEKLGIDNLVGTPLLRGYMHGFFIDSSLYSKIRSVANPFEFEEYRKKKIKEKIEAKRASRITAKKDSKVVGTGINKDLAERLADKSQKGKKAGKTADQLLSDNRFGSLFDNPDFAIDESAEDFKLRNPSGVAGVKDTRNDEDMDSDRDEDDEGEREGKEGVEEKWGDESDGSDDDDRGNERVDRFEESDDSDDDDGFRGAKVRGARYEAEREMEKQLKKEKEKQKEISKKKEEKEKEKGSEKKKGKKKAKMTEGYGDKDQNAEVELGERLAKMEEEAKSKSFKRKFDSRGAVREFTYVPKSKEAEEDNKKAKGSGGRSRKERRGVKDLKLK
ncbi:hypothetical protein TL16_g11989 [Triparma laevis f. inornata]|uniref:NUC153 domain-containing protein n=2 Tax=Triparma laevis TaxID=1534972 RepID=A0A9W7C5G5_9STRA|nr:hypothetical protein TL16_g11989 [Triparma laevis f. inornata]GMI02247.1 hypothetical protein TrLO_g6058 [Triparma laevis f. longispina]